MPENKKNKRKQPNRLLTLTMVATQMGVTIFLGASLGKYLDQRYSTPKPWFTISLTLFSLLVSLYSVLKQVNKLNDDEH
ncbi:MAG: AtpZ/AtpI family protein [Flavobacteriales bacterium]|nr:AtpZ/AtpI family protein [Flavobacteriales bacterium]MBL6872719.1 AtpZ/AtpI family protein [Flavobacteriales bacterium]